MPTINLLDDVINAINLNNQETTQQQVLDAQQASVTAIGTLLTDSQLRAAPVDAQDDYDGDIITADQTGAGAVLTFNLGSAAVLVAVDVDAAVPADTDPYIARASVGATIPTATLGWRCRSGQTTFLPVPCPSGVVRVYAPSGVTVSVQAATRA